MLEEIRIGSLGVIESSTLELGPGLTVFTGETGAGKTMLVTALGLLLGGRADSGIVRTGATTARVEGVVGLAALPSVSQAVEEAGGEVEDGRVVLARNVSAEGRSRAFAGGASVPVSVLADLTQPLVAVHGQSDQYRLLTGRAQREALDRFAGDAVARPLAQYTERRRRLLEVETELDEVVSAARERAREADLLRFGLAEIAAVEPRPGEDAELAAEESRLGFADTLRAAAERAREALSSEQDEPDALGAAARARSALESVRDHDAEAGALAERLAELTYLLSDLSADVASYASGLETDPGRLAAVSERRAALTALTRKYGDTIDEVLSWAEQSAARLADLDDTDGRVDRLREEAATLRTDLAATAAKLTAARVKAARSLAERVSAELRLLAMPDARLSIEIRQQEVQPPVHPPGAEALLLGERWLRFGSAGVDEVELQLTANRGSPARPIAKAASGGELSRVMLAIEVVLAGTSPVPTFVFDEVDAGVGGRAAVEVGRRLAELARTSQVLVVTHLPQVAAYADRHVVVEKSSDGTVTTSGLTVLDAESRERELSRMFAGMEESDSALAHARELLETAAPGRALS
jgi:DNA repair protein RecN (Recombination protein N)